MKRRDRELGMDRPISRRDFISGVSVAVSGSLLYPWAEAHGAPRIQFAPEREAGYYPPARTGMRGSHEGSYEVAHELVEGKTWDGAADTGESYDLVVVGGGISGLATAYYFQQQVGPKARILILDNHDDFGGHAKRNEFHHDGRLLLMNGGTIYIEDFAYYDDAGQRLLRELGLEIERNSEFENPDVYRSRKLSHGVFFDKETFGTDHLAVGKGELPWAEFLAKAPLTEAACKDIARYRHGALRLLQARPRRRPSPDPAQLHRRSCSPPWRAASCPGSYHQMVLLSEPISMGTYHCSGSPEEPMVLDLRRTPISPGLPAAQQFKLGKYELLETSFETFERKIRDQLGRMLADGGFDPARDIGAITVNRWPHGYAYGYDPVEDEVAWLPDEWPEEKRTWVVGRQRFGRISIANSDANATAMTEGALGAAHRAAQEVIGQT